MVSMAEAFDFQVESLEQEIACVTPGVTADVTAVTATGGVPREGDRLCNGLYNV